ncbi:MAG: nickel pincer cofactor biosynthesis protein LarC [Dehalococcoidia bacterium]|nr:nickel pincer cofactor biosynthesis protein LarC [Dehalococcoidia bacterium]
MKTAYLNLIGGASGDMLLAALLDAGLPLDILRAELAKLPVAGYTFAPAFAQRAGIHGTHLKVDIANSANKKAYTWRDFRGFIQESGFSDTIKERGLEVFSKLAIAERRAHKDEQDNLDAELCELGSLDTLVDVMGVVAGFKALGVERICSSPFPAGAGTMHSDHGPLPAAGPATMELIAMANAPVTAPGDVRGEMVTPTGAALVTALAEFRRPTLRLEKMGHGLGTKDIPNHPNVVDVWIGEEQYTPVPDKAGGLTLLETNIDDMTPQLFGYVQERLLTIGALDVWFTSIQMKKNRPAVLLSVMIPGSLEAQVVELLFKETSTLGVRTRQIQRHEAPRDSISIKTSLGAVSVKVKQWNGKPVGVAPEFDDCRALAQQLNLPLQEVMARVTREAAQQLGL